MVTAHRAQWIATAVCAGTVAAVLAHERARPSIPPTSTGHSQALNAIGIPGAPPTSAAGLRQRIEEMEARLRADAHDTAAGLLLADALLRQARASIDGRATNRAAAVLEGILRDSPGHYDALRFQGAVELSRHRFREALAAAQSARNQRPDDAWNYGVMGDALVELGRYDEAFAAFDRMASLRPNADAYARVSYARELRGDLAGALGAMQLAAGATSEHDAEAKSWCAVHVGDLLLKLGRVGEAEREYRRADFYYRQYPAAVVGLAVLDARRGDENAALAALVDQLRRTPTLDLAARVGDIHAARGEIANAERYYALAETLAGPSIAQTEAALALFLAERDRKPAVALQIAQAVAATRDDIFTNDALAWALFKNGRLAQAAATIERAQRTGSRDARIVQHAAAIRAQVAATSATNATQPASNH